MKIIRNIANLTTTRKWNVHKLREAQLTRSQFLIEVIWENLRKNITHAATEVLEIMRKYGELTDKRHCPKISPKYEEFTEILKEIEQGEASEPYKINNKLLKHRAKEL